MSAEVLARVAWRSLHRGPVSSALYGAWLPLSQVRDAVACRNERHPYLHHWVELLPATRSQPIRWELSRNYVHWAYQGSRFVGSVYHHPRSASWEASFGETWETSTFRRRVDAKRWLECRVLRVGPEQPAAAVTHRAWSRDANWGPVWWERREDGLTWRQSSVESRSTETLGPWERRALCDVPADLAWQTLEEIEQDKAKWRVEEGALNAEEGAKYMRDENKAT